MPQRASLAHKLCGKVGVDRRREGARHRDDRSLQLVRLDGGANATANAVASSLVDRVRDVEDRARIKWHARCDSNT